LRRLNDIAARRQRRVVGLISGTSADGIDAALVQLQGDGEQTRVETEAFITADFSEKMRQAVLGLCRPEATLDELCRLNAALGEVFADAALQVIEAAGLRPEQVDLIGSHGQTVRHLPDGSPPSTLQIGEPAVIAARSGIVTIADFRPADMAVGGQGAPLVPWVDYLLFRAAVGRIMLNIGGISNITVLAADAVAAGVEAFDLGPGNALMDEAASRLCGVPFDRDGALAAAGHVDDKVLDELLSHEYLLRPPPKSTGREAFGAPFFEVLLKRHRLAPRDWLATLTAFTARSIAAGIGQFVCVPMQEVWVSGGGAYNAHLMSLLRQALPDLRVGVLDELGVSADAKEAVAFAVLANETLAGGAGNLPSATGASRPMVLGKIVQAS
jgi:anhydro-N-acetylmuramic acid kinase